MNLPPTSHVQVIPRFRPSRKRAEGDEQKAEEKDLSTLFDPSSPTELTVDCETRGKKTFYFDHVLWSDATQIDVFEVAGRPVVLDALRGYNCTIFVYGPPRSGKTHTLWGLESDDHGILLRSVDTLFEMLENAIDVGSFSLKMSCVGVHHRELHDLLDPTTGARLRIRSFEDVPTVDGLTKEFCGSRDEAVKLVQRAYANRPDARRRMVDQSHIVIAFELLQKMVPGSLRSSILTFCDLAPDVTGRTQQFDRNSPAGSAHTSLYVLKRTVEALGDPNVNHIPYRESQLTQLLKHSLGGNAKTTFLIACSADSHDVEETWSALTFGQSLQKVQNRAHINEEMTSQQYLARIAELEEHNAELRDQVRSLQSLSKVSWARMLSQASGMSRSRFLSDPRAPEIQSTVPVQENANETESHDSILAPVFHQSSTVSSYGSLRQLMTADEVSRPLGLRNGKSSSFSSQRRDLLGFCSILFMLVCLQLLFQTTEKVNRIYGNPIFLQWISGVFLLLNIIPAYIFFVFSNRQGSVSTVNLGTISAPNDGFVKSLVSPVREKFMDEEFCLPLNKVMRPILVVSVLAFAFVILWTFGARATTMSTRTTIFESQVLVVFILSITLFEDAGTVSKTFATILTFVGVILSGFAPTTSFQKYGTNKASGTFEIVVCALFYALYLLTFEIITKKFINERRITSSLQRAFYFLTMMGAAFLVFFWPIILIAHWTGVETFKQPTDGQWGVIIGNSLLRVVVMILLVVAVVMTSAAYVSIGQTLVIPVALCLSVIKSGDSRPMGLVGSGLIVAGFLVFLWGNGGKGHDIEISTKTRTDSLEPSYVIAVTAP